MKKNPMPEIPDFTPTQCYTSADKQKFAKTFIRFLNSGCNFNIFSKEFYNHLSNCMGHIAHFNRHGFYSEWFASNYKRASFISHWLSHPIYGDPEYTFSDVERFLQGWIRKEYSTSYGTWFNLEPDEVIDLCHE